MPAPRINPALMSATMRANLEKVQAQLSLGNGNAVYSAKDEEIESQPKKQRQKKKTLTPDMVDGLVKSVKVSEDGDEVEIVLGMSASMLPTHQQKGAFVGKDGHVHFFTKSHIAKAEKALRIAFEPYAHLFNGWGDSPRAVYTTFCFPFNESTPIKNRIPYSYHTQRSDADNLYKGLGDSMTEAGFWPDDSVIAELHLRKFRVLEEPYIAITIRKLPPYVYEKQIQQEFNF